MHVVALSTRRQAESTYRAAGVHPITFPPYDPDSFHPFLLQGTEFLYVKLHGLPGQPYWYGDQMATAISAEQIAHCALEGAIVFSATCHLTGEGGRDDPAPTHPMLEALFRAGAQAVVGGSGVNFARPQSVDGADTLGRAFRHLCGMGMDPARAFHLALAGVSLRRLSPAVMDTLDFRLHLPPESDQESENQEDDQ